MKIIVFHLLASSSLPAFTNIQVCKWKAQKSSSTLKKLITSSLKMGGGGQNPKLLLEVTSMAHSCAFTLVRKLASPALNTALWCMVIMCTLPTAHVTDLGGKWFWNQKQASSQVTTTVTWHLKHAASEIPLSPVLLFTCCESIELIPKRQHLWERRKRNTMQKKQLNKNIPLNHPAITYYKTKSSMLITKLQFHRKSIQRIITYPIFTSSPITKP